MGGWSRHSLPKPPYECPRRRTLEPAFGDVKLARHEPPLVLLVARSHVDAANPGGRRCFDDREQQGEPR